MGKPAAEHTLAYALQKGHRILYSADTLESFHMPIPKKKRKSVSKGKPESRFNLRRRVQEQHDLFTVRLITQKCLALSENGSFNLIG